MSSLTRIFITHCIIRCSSREHLVLIRLARLLLFNFLTWKRYENKTESAFLFEKPNAQSITKVDLRAMPFHSYPYKNSFVTDILGEAGVSPALIPTAWATPRSAYYFRQARDSKNRLYICTNPYAVDEIFRHDGRIFEKFAHLLSRRIYTALVVMPNDEISIFDTVNSRW